MPFYISYNDTADVLGAILRGHLAWDDHAQRDGTIGVLLRRTSISVAILLCISADSGTLILRGSDSFQEKAIYDGVYL